MTSYFCGPGKGIASTASASTKKYFVHSIAFSFGLKVSALPESRDLTWKPQTYRFEGPLNPQSPKILSFKP